MLFPKKTKYRKWQTHRKHADKLNLPDTRGTKLAFGSFGVKATTQARITSNQIEAARRAMTREAGKGAKIWIRIFPDRPVTAKAAEVGMGKGKGDPKGFVMDVRPGRVLFEIDGVGEEVSRASLRKAGMKLPMTVKIVGRE